MFMFLAGIAMCIPAPTSKHDEDQGLTIYQKKEMLAAKLSETSISPDDGLTPKEAVKTKEFVLLSLKIMLTELVFFYLLFVYKVQLITTKLGKTLLTYWLTC